MKEFVKEIPTNIGVVEIIEISRKNRPLGLRKPYEYLLPRAKFENKYKKLQNYCKTNANGFQHLDIWQKGLTKGTRITFFALSHADDVSKKQWNGVCAEVQKLLQNMLGPDAKMYVEPWNKENKFQAQYEAYLMFEEMQ